MARIEMLEFITRVNDLLWHNFVLWFLLLAGVFFTVYLGFVQWRFFPASIKALLFSKTNNKKQISSFQALCTSLAQRVGTGNLAGVAAAITYGGEGAIFWMWVTAILGSSTAFAESTLAQVYKIRKPDGTFYGGPAYYIHAGLRSKPLAMIFSFSLIIAMGFVFNSVQSNTIAHGLSSAFGIPPLISGILLAICSSLIIFGGRKRIAQVAEVIVPFMALSYLAMTLFVLLIYINEMPALLARIFYAAFNSQAAVGGVIGHTVQQAIRHGVARGLFSNEAGWGSAPNAAASADVEHPVQQGLVQMLAVYIDTLLICTSTAVLIMLARDMDPDLTGIALTQAASVFHFGHFGKIFVGIAIMLFGFTTILGNTFYGEANVQFIINQPSAVLIYRVLILAMVVIGSILEVPLVWQMADLMSAVMTVINLVSIVLMAAIIKRTTHHFRSKFLTREEPSFSFSQIGLRNFSSYAFAYDRDNPEHGA
ncbi:MAG TPA: alanine/glycine:cation symporter family protein [Myxococcota bacterium]|nr:alanine/glycine:cation symporter family protein [Myxococcota bacterium]